MSNNKDTKINAGLRSQGIYRDKYNRFIYFDKRQNCGYVIPEDGLKRFGIVQNRIVIGVITAVLCYAMLKLNIYLSIFIGVGILGGLEAIFRFSMLPEYVKIPKFTPDTPYDKKRDPYIGTSKLRFNFIVLAYIAFGIVLIGSTLVFKSNQTTDLLMVALGLLSFYMAFITFYNANH